MSLETELCGIKLNSPFVLASGILGVSPSLLSRISKTGIGAVTTKSVGPAFRAGHANPICFDWGKGIINAVGLPGPGAEKQAEMLKKTKAETPVIASIFAGTEEEFASVALEILKGEPDALELNISCPNVKDDFGIPFAAKAETAAAVTAAVRKVCDTAIFVKLAPNVPDVANIAKTVVNAGADGITAINTVPGMVIDTESALPILTNGSGGISGPAIKPVAIKCVYDIAKAVPDTPIIGTGGILNGTDAAEMLMAGATAIGVGSAVYYHGVEVFSRLNSELAEFMASHDFQSVKDLSRLTHKKQKELS